MLTGSRARGCKTNGHHPRFLASKPLQLDKSPHKGRSIRPTAGNTRSPFIPTATQTRTCTEVGMNVVARPSLPQLEQHSASTIRRTPSFISVPRASQMSCCNCRAGVSSRSRHAAALVMSTKPPSPSSTWLDTQFEPNHATRTSTSRLRRLTIAADACAAAL